MGRIIDEDVQALRERADLAAIVAEYTSLQRAGGGRLKGLCPFHQEKTPSFTVDPARGFYHCFGCGQGGDVYAFVRAVEALSFPEAVERVARTAGYELRYAELRPGERKALGRRTRLIEALGEAARFYVAQLAGPDGAQARAYLASRGVDEGAVRHFRLGWAPDRWDGMVRHLQGAFEPQEIAEAGLATQGKRGMIDRFRGRVLFPILDRAGRDVVAFGGRLLPGVALRAGSAEAPKYINSAESPVYKKSEILYGLSWARSEIVRRGAALVVEGYMDVIGLHLVGARHAVATCGTALTADHFRQLERFAPRVVLALDADDAGFAAAERARGLAEEVGIREVTVLELPAGQDPADLATGGAAAVDDALETARTALGFQLEHLLRDVDVSTPEAQAEAYRRTFPVLERIGDRFLRYRYIRDVVAPAVRLSADLIERELDTGGSGAAAPRSSSVPAHRRPAASERPASPQVQLERDVLRIALQRPEFLPSQWEQLDAGDFTAPLARELFAALGSAPPGDLDAVLAVLPDDQARTRVRALALSEPTVDEAGQARKMVTDLLAAGLTRRRDEVRAELVRVHEQLNPAERGRLLAREFELRRQRDDLVEGRQAYDAERADGEPRPRDHPSGHGCRRHPLDADPASR
ncbi:MAG: DNA primase [Egibacteraceae bacterium]